MRIPWRLLASSDVLVVNMSDTDMELLARYTRQHAEDAFAELVRRHLDLVHSAALRQVCSPQLAEEVAQATFLKLARHASQFPPNTVVTAWLYQVTRREAIDVVRRESRRQLREQIATEMNAMNATAADWTHIGPLLDEAMHALDDTDRTAVLLRYFENKSLREVGATLGTSENAAQKRLGRAVERLREFFAKRGVTVGGSGLVVVISANAVQAAPAGLSASIAAAVAGITIATAGTATIITMSWLNAKSAAAIIGAAVLAGTGTYVVQQQKLVRMDAVHRALLSQQAQASASHDETLATLRARDLAIAGLRKDNADLPRLRNEITQLQAAAQTMTAKVGLGMVSAPLDTNEVPIGLGAMEVAGKVSAARDGQALAGAIVHVVSGIRSGAESAGRESPELVVRGSRLIPDVLVVRTGETFTVKNADAAVYNVHIRFRQNSERNLGLTSRGQLTTKVDRPELFARISEDLYRLNGYVCVMEHPFYALTDATGTFKMPALPAGTYTVEAAHPREGRITKEITIAEAKSSVEFLLPGRQQ
jgi:RNA polymerase sigma factor (sigma-70 family)